VITERDIEQIREGYRLINEREVVRDFIAENFLLEQTPGIPGTRGTFHGPEGMRAALNELLSGFDAVRFDPQRFERHGDWLIVSTGFWASARGFETTAELIHIWKIENHHATRMRVLTAEADPIREIEKIESGE
jgi:hypothetical protein